jgi:SAM-dependent methyltransferase
MNPDAHPGRAVHPAHEAAREPAHEAAHEAAQHRDGGAALAELRADWTRLGEADPLWAVCVDPARRGGRWDLEEFNATGRAEIAAALTELDRLGLCERRERALDFGCGVGRLTAALAGQFGEATGADISRPMLEQAARINAADGRCRYVHNDTADLRAFPDQSFDLVYSSLVLQHIPPVLARAYLAEFVRVLRPGGAIMLLVPVAHARTLHGMVYAIAPHRVTGWIQRRLFGYPAAMRMHTLPARRVRRVVEPLGATLADSVPHPGYGGHWRMALHIVTRRA